MTHPEVSSVGIDVSGRVISLDQLQAELEAGDVALPNGLTIAGPPQPFDPSAPPPLLGGPPPPCSDGSKLFTYDDQGNPADLPPEAVPIVNNYTYRTP
jgi:hypothetical protein